MKSWLKDNFLQCLIYKNIRHCKKYFTTPDYNNSANNILDVNIKSKKLLSKSDVSKFMKNFDLNEKIRILATKAESRAKRDKIEKLKTYD